LKQLGLVGHIFIWLDQDLQNPHSSNLVRIHFLHLDHLQLRAEGTLIFVCHSIVSVPLVQQDSKELEADRLNQLDFKLEFVPDLLWIIVAKLFLVVLIGVPLDLKLGVPISVPSNL
jgi:hypothetical protein